MSGEDSATSEQRWGTRAEYTTQLPRCLCFGERPSARQARTAAQPRPPITADDATHVVWVAFLLYDNDEYEGERSMRDYLFLPMNRLTVMLTGEDFIHCQMVFWDARQRRYYTYSVDAQRPVHVWDRKGFRAGWKFVRLRVTERQEVLMQNFLARQLGKPINRSGQLTVLFWPTSGRGESWFCSELVTAALDEAGLVDYEAWHDVTKPADAAPHHIFHYLTEQCTRCVVELMAGNPVQITSVHERAASRGSIAIRRGQLPQAVADFAERGAVANFIAALPVSTAAPAPQAARRTSPPLYYQQSRGQAQQSVAPPAASSSAARLGSLIVKKPKR